MSTPDPRDRSILTPDVDVTAQAAPKSPGGPEPDLTRTGEAVASERGRSAGVTLLAVRWLARVRVPTPLGAGIVVLGLVGILGFGVYQLADPVQRWVARAPETLATARERVRRLTRPVEQVSKTAEQVANAASGTGPQARTNEVVVKGPSIVSRVFGTTQRLLAALLEVVVLLYFLLAAGDLFLQKLIKVLPEFTDKKTAVQIARETEASISTYLLSALMMNVGEGVVVAAAMYLIGMPNPMLWGALVVLLEFVPYLGALTMVVILTVAALVTFDSVGHALLAPGAFLAINLVQANVVYPLLMSRRLTLNPVAVFVGLAFWWWLWGIPGAFLAVPLLATFKIFCDHIASLASIGEFLGERDEGERRRTVRLEE
jgi:predicted PurR-regulated permease PerM